MAEFELSVVIPCYNELRSLPDILRAYDSERGGVNFQLVVVDNGSSDGTWEFLAGLRAKYGFIKAVRIEKNIGYGNGIHRGLLECDSDVVGWSHGDLQCSPADVFRAYDVYLKSRQKKLLVKGHRHGRDWKPLILTYGLELLSTLVLMRRFDDINGQPKLFPRELTDSLRNPPLGFSYDLYVQYKALSGGYAVKCFPVAFEQRAFGVSRWAHSVLSRISTITGFITDVLRIKAGVID